MARSRQRSPMPYLTDLAYGFVTCRSRAIVSSRRGPAWISAEFKWGACACRASIHLDVEARPRHRQHVLTLSCFGSLLLSSRLSLSADSTNSTSGRCDRRGPVASTGGHALSTRPGLDLCRIQDELLNSSPKRNDGLVRRPEERPCVASRPLSPFPATASARASDRDPDTPSRARRAR